MKINLTLFIFLLLGGSTYGQPVDFNFTTTNISGVFTGQAQINGTNATAQDWVAAFDSDGNCAGAGQIIINADIAYINLAIYGDDPNTTLDEGIGVGEAFTIKIWDASENNIIDYTINGVSSEFSNWVNNNGAPMPSYNDPTIIYDFILFQPMSFQSTVIDILCFGNNTGEITLEIIGGSGDFTINWNDGNTGTINSNLPSGDYDATITDNQTNETLNTGNISITSPDEIMLTLTSEDEMNGDGQGTATVDVTGGVPNYQFLWNDPIAQTTATATGLSEGEYTVTITDNNQCTKEGTVMVVNDPMINTTNLNKLIKINVSPIPAKDYLNIDLINVPLNIKLKYSIFDMMGKKCQEGIFRASNYMKIDISQLVQGTYILAIIRDNEESVMKKFNKK